MKDKLYYTPELEEFHPGFEYEMCLRNKEGATFWQRRTVGPQDWQGIWNIPFSINKGYRVKHLDKEDIESLGFEPRDLNHWEDEEEEVIYKKGNYTLVFWKNAYKSDYKTNVYIRQERGLGQHSFKGEVKNKSELKKLLKMLGIL